jgi:hypothetical protein
MNLFRFASLVYSAVCLIGIGVASAQPYTSESKDGGVITVISLKRSGSDSVILKGSIENPGAGDLKFGDLLEDVRKFSAVLQDPVGKKEYQQIRVDRVRVGSEHNPFVAIPPHGKINFWARITAPPPEVEKVTVVFAGSALPIEDVPLQK